MKAVWRGSLRAKIIAWSFVPTAIVLSAFAWMSYSSSQKGIGDTAMLEDQKLATAQSAEVNRAVALLVNPPIQAIMLEVDTDHAAPIQQRARKILQEAPKLSVFDGGIFFTDPSGTVVVASPEDSSRLLGQGMSHNPSFQYIRTNPGLAIFLNIEPYGPHGEDSACMVISLPDAAGEFAGASFYCFLVLPDPSTVFNQAMSAAGFGSQFYLLDGNQRLVYASDLSQIGSELSSEPYIQQALADPKKAARVRKGTQDLVLSYDYLSNLPSEMKAVNWTVMRETPWADVMRPWLVYRLRLLVLLVLGLTLPVLLAFTGAKRITGPIQSLMHAAEQVTAGRFSHRIEVKTGDEIERLADQFNLMSERLDESYSSLEEKVADRTRQLEILNAIISTASRSLDIHEILEEALDKTAEQMGFEAGAAFRADSEAAPLVLVTQRGFEPTISLDTLTNQAARFLAEENAGRVTCRQQAGKGAVHLLVFVPLSAKSRTLGLFLLSRPMPGALSADEVSLLDSIGRQVGVAMENARLYEAAEGEAIAAERQRLARELHDAVTQTLFSANLIADVIPRVWDRDPSEGRQNLEELRTLTRGALAEMRTLLLEMRPEALGSSDIRSLVTQLADAFTGRARIPIQLQIEGNCEPPHEVKLAFYRTAQETLNNIARHSGARKIQVRLSCEPGHMSLCVRDDGLGFDPASIPPGHMGLAIMRERAEAIHARLILESEPGQGTTVELDWQPAGKD